MNKLKHLDYIQDTIKRMSSNSFIVKGWTIAVATTVIVLMNKTESGRLWILSILPVIVFWWLDSFYLYKERLFRSLYDKVRKLPESEIDFDMNTTPFKGKNRNWSSTILSFSISVFYISIIVLVILLILCL